MRTIFFCALFALSPAAYAQERVLPHHGRLLDAADQPVTATLQFKFAIYDKARKPLQNEPPETKFWEGTYDVQLVGGSYSVLLGGDDGQEIPEDALAGGPRWMGVTIGEGTELEPRMRIGIVAAAAEALDVRCDGCVETGHLAAGAVDVTRLAADAVDSAQIKGGAVTGAKIAASAVDTPQINRRSRTTRSPPRRSRRTRWAARTSRRAR
jgi:hypothetical protein